MAYEVKGVVARSKGAPVTVETVIVPDPGPGEAVVDVQACGVCHTDLHYREGGINDEFPFLLGHEAAGTVAAVGEGVTNVAVGDYVILNWRAVCGQCRACLKGDPEAPATAAGLLGCGVMAGVGAAINTGAVRRGESVAVFGCGGVGDAAIAGAKLAGASTIIAVGHPAVFEQAFYARDLAGRVILVGVPTPDMTITLPLIEVFGRGGAIKSSWYGDCLPSRDFPMLVDLYRQGRFPLEDFVSETIGLDAVEQAFEKMHHGDVLRSVVVF